MGDRPAETGKERAAVVKKRIRLVCEGAVLWQAWVDALSTANAAEKDCDADRAVIQGLDKQIAEFERRIAVAQADVSGIGKEREAERLEWETAVRRLKKNNDATKSEAEKRRDKAAAAAAADRKERDDKRQANIRRRGAASLGLSEEEVQDAEDEHAAMTAQHLQRVAEAKKKAKELLLLKDPRVTQLKKVMGVYRSNIAGIMKKKRKALKELAGREEILHAAQAEVQRCHDARTYDTSLPLANLRLKAIPLQVLGIHHLSSLDVSHNQLDGMSVSTRLRELTALESLNLNHNTWPAGLPDTVFALSSLTRLSAEGGGMTALRFESPAEKQAREKKERAAVLAESAVTGLVARMRLRRQEAEAAAAASEPDTPPPIKPSYLDDLVRLRHLHLSDNLLEGLPPSLSAVTTLESLDVSRNRVTSLPCLASLSALTHLDVASNPLPVLPTSLQSLHLLTSLNAADCGLVAPPRLRHCSSLATLCLSRNSRMPGLARMDDCSALTTLDAQHCSVKSLSASLRHLTSLQTLQLSHNRLTVLKPWAGNWGALTDLNLSHNLLTRLPQSIRRLVHLTSLDVSHNQLDCLPTGIRRLGKLTSLNLSHNSIDTLIGSTVRDPTLTLMPPHFFATSAASLKTVQPRTRPGTGQTSRIRPGTGASSRPMSGRPRSGRPMSGRTQAGLLRQGADPLRSATVASLLSPNVSSLSFLSSGMTPQQVEAKLDSVEARANQERLSLWLWLHYVKGRPYPQTVTDLGVMATARVEAFQVLGLDHDSDSDGPVDGAGDLPVGYNVEPYRVAAAGLLSDDEEEDDDGDEEEEEAVVEVGGDMGDGEVLGEPQPESEEEEWVMHAGGVPTDSCPSSEDSEQSVETVCDDVVEEGVEETKAEVVEVGVVVEKEQKEEDGDDDGGGDNDGGDGDDTGDCDENDTTTVPTTPIVSPAARRRLRRQRRHDRRQAGALAECTSLTCLDLSYNCLSTIPDAMFAHLSALSQLDISYNRLCTLPTSIVTLPALERLSAQYNLLEHVPADWSGCGARLTEIRFMHNHLTTTPDLTTLPALRLIDLQFNQLAPASVPSMTGASHALCMKAGHNPFHHAATSKFDTRRRRLEMERVLVAEPPADMAPPAVLRLLSMLADTLSASILGVTPKRGVTDDSDAVGDVAVNTRARDVCMLLLERAGTLKRHMHDVDAAMRDLDRAVSMSGGHPLALCLRGQLRLECGDVDGAGRDLSAAIKRDPSSFVAQASLAEVHLRLGNWDAAIQDVRRALGVALRIPGAGVADAVVRDADILKYDREQANRVTGFAEEYKTEDDKENTEFLSPGAASMLMQQRALTRALDRCGVHPLYIRALALRASLASKVGGLELAHRFCCSVLRLQPLDPNTRYLRASINRALGRRVAASMDADKGLEGLEHKFSMDLRPTGVEVEPLSSQLRDVPDELRPGLVRLLRLCFTLRASLASEGRDDDTAAAFTRLAGELDAKVV